LETFAMRASLATSLPTQDEIARALHEWHSARALAMASPKAELYACAAALVMELLERHITCAELVTAFYFPDITLMQVAFELCAGGEIPLQPRLIMGAACATRLRQLVGAALA
jgi:hypothetical protein